MHQFIIEKYLEKRRANVESKAGYAYTTPRTLLGIIRLSQAMARLRLSEEIEQNDAIFENFTFQDLVNLGHSEFCPTKIFVETKTFFEGKTNHLYLPYTSHFRSNGCFGGRQGRTELFIRGVLIKDFYFNIPTIASIFEIKTIVANITSKNFIPDISRNNIDASSKEDLNSILGRAIHFGACKTMSFAADEKETIRKFIDTFYVPNPSYEKSQA